MQKVIDEGEFAGHQAVILRPAKPFQLTELPREVRKRIYAIYFAPNGVVNGEIVLEGKDTKKNIFAKAYSEGQKDRVALLRVSKDVSFDATQILYNHVLRIESTTTLVDLLSQHEKYPTTKANLRKLNVKSYIKTTSRTALQLLAGSPHVSYLNFDLGVAGQDDTAKAAKDFHTDAERFFDAVYVEKKKSEKNKNFEKRDVVDILSFGREAFKRKLDKEKGGKAKAWDEDMREEFFENLKAKLK